VLDLKSLVGSVLGLWLPCDFIENIGVVELQLAGASLVAA
jgi:hypothetical protein